jgi:hypothetical protein
MQRSISWICTAPDRRPQVNIVYIGGNRQARQTYVGSDRFLGIAADPQLANVISRDFGSFWRRLPKSRLEQPMPALSSKRGWQPSVRRSLLGVKGWLDQGRRLRAQPPRAVQLETGDRVRVGGQQGIRGGTLQPAAQLSQRRASPVTTGAIWPGSPTSTT